jgi:hypothetical protein
LLLRDNSNLVAVGAVDGRLEDDLVAVLDAGIDLDFGAVIGGDGDLVQTGDAVDLHGKRFEHGQRMVDLRGN